MGNLLRLNNNNFFFQYKINKEKSKANHVVNKALNVEMPAALLGPPTGNGGGISSPRVLPWLRRIYMLHHL